MKVHMGSRDKFPLMAEINMIPLIDVSLVLLIIFMVVTPFLASSQIKINLPKAVSGNTTNSQPIKIQITAQKTFYIDGQVTLAQDLSSILKNKLAEQKDAAVLIEADSTVPFEFVVQAMDQAKLHGALKLGVSVLPPQN